jgi:site-specific DNA-methyltransferase (adenine-specific)
MDCEPFTLEVKDETPAVVTVPAYGTLDLRRADCMDMMAEFPDGYFDLAIVDPPYGIRVGDDKRGIGRRKGHARASYKMGEWDHEASPLEYFAELRRISRNQIVWGANYFIERMPINSSCWIVWDKMFSNEVSFAAVELAWTSFDSPAKKFQYRSPQDGRIHPTQKPVALYQWLLANYAKPCQRILDTHLGSGSHAIACYYAGMHLTACEIDEDYFKAASERIERETAQTVLF